MATPRKKSSPNPQNTPPTDLQMVAPGSLALPDQATSPPQAPWQPSGWETAVDTAVGCADDALGGGAVLVSGVPVLGPTTASMAPVAKSGWEVAGGLAKRAGDLVSGLGHMVVHPLDTAAGVATMLEHIPGSPLKPLHKLYDVATTDQTFMETFWRNPLDVAKEVLSADYDFWSNVLGAIADPYERSIEQRKYGEALGRGIFDVSSLLMGAGEAKALGKGAEVVNTLDHVAVANKVDDAMKLAGKANELGTVTDDVVRARGKADDVTKAASHEDEAADLSKADDATKLTDQVEEGAAPLASTAEDAARTGDQLSGPATNQPRVSQVSSGGKRGEVPLTPEQQAEILAYTRMLEIPDKIVRFSENMNTSYAQLFGEEVLYVGTDVTPAADKATRAASANARVSWKGAIAHEAVGHREAALAGKTQDSVLLEEAQASVRAARLGPDLSRAERFTLLRDAVERLHAGGLSVRDVKDLLWTE